VASEPTNLTTGGLTKPTPLMVIFVVVEPSGSTTVGEIFEISGADKAKLDF
jgi:hypothetical protein